MTLDELKQKNRAEEEALQAAQPVETTDETLQPEAEDLGDTGSATGDTGEETDGQAVPEWMQTGDQTPGDGNVPVKTHVAMKHKLKGQLQEKDGKLEQLEQEIQNLKAGQTAGAPVAQPQPPSQLAPMPKAEDFYDQADPDAAHAAAMQRWIDRGVEQRLQTHLNTHQQTQAQKQQQEQVSQALDQHYQRAANIVSEGLLTAEEYQGFDRYLRQTVESVAPGNGDSFVDTLLGRMGEGSEKVVVSLARNPAHMARFQQSLRDDPTGLSAATFLGELRGKFIGAGTRVSQTPRPGTSLQGDGGKEGGSDQRQYKAAHKSGNRQKAFDIKWAAKARGIDVSKW